MKEIIETKYTVTYKSVTVRKRKKTSFTKLSNAVSYFDEKKEDGKAPVLALVELSKTTKILRK